MLLEQLKRSDKIRDCKKGKLSESERQNRILPSIFYTLLNRALEKHQNGST